PGFDGFDEGFVVVVVAGLLVRVTVMTLFGHELPSVTSLFFSVWLTVNLQRILIATQFCMYRHLPSGLGGSQSTGSLSLFDAFDVSLTAIKVRRSLRSLANDLRRSVVQLRAPESHASASATTWSMSTCDGLLRVLLS